MFFLQLFAQKKKASDKVYSANGYGEYIEMTGEDYAKMDRPTLEKLAIASRKTGDYRKSEKLYAALIEMGAKNAYNHLYYAQALQSNGHYFKAREHFRICDEKLQDKANGKPYDQRGRLGYEACDKVAEMKSLGEVHIENEIILNTGKFDFSPTYYKRGILFVSTRNKLGGKHDRWLNDNFMDLYYAPLAEGNELNKPILFAKELNSDLHEGPSVFSKDEKILYFTRNDYNKGKRGKAKDGTTKLKIFAADYQEDDKWGNIRELPFNNKEYDVCHPALSPDEKMLVFAANLPNGYGGMDLWVSHFRKNTWQKPVNLGAKINTEGNEVFPFIHQDGTLFYSSNGLSSLGGLDIFMATQIYNHPDSLWEFPFNLGVPVNSSADDFGIIMNQSKTEGFLTSSRAGGAGGDDIYRFKIKDGLDEVKPTPTLSIDVCVYNDETRERIENAAIKIKRISKQGVPINAYSTNQYGYTSCKMRAGEKYIINVSKYGYTNMKETFIMPNTVEGLDEFCIGLKRDPAIEIVETTALPRFRNIDSAATPSLVEQGQVEGQSQGLSQGLSRGQGAKPLAKVNYQYDPNVKIEGPQVRGKIVHKDLNQPLENARITLLNRCTGQELIMEVAADGSYAFPLQCGCEYVIKSNKNRFLSDNHILSLRDEKDCDKPIELELGLIPDFDIGESSSSFSEPIVENIKEGDIIELKNIYYDYDKWAIRPDAAKDLDDLVILLQKYPSMEVELSSHTDIRGSDSYNKILSDKRAKAAMEYILQKGIAANRLTAKGYGESQLKNNCSFCTETDHQENRRTEAKITKLIKR